MVERESPKGKRVSLFVTCMVDMLYPETGLSVVDVLTHLGVDVDFPLEQTCCGQPAFNAGYHDEARQVAIQFLKAFKEAQVIASRVTRGEFPCAIQMMSRGLLHPDLLITSVQPLGNIGDAFRQIDQESPDTIKIVLDVKDV